MRLVFVVVAVAPALQTALVSVQLLETRRSAVFSARVDS